MRTQSYRQRDAVSVHHSRSGATNSQVINVTDFQKSIGHQSICDPNLFLLGKSVQMRCYYSEAELEQLRLWFPSLFEGIKEGFKTCISLSRQHQNQPFPSPENFESLIAELLRQEKQALLLKIYHFIFDQKINYCIVFFAFAEFRREHSWLTGFSKIMSDPLTLMVNSAMEYAKYTQHQVTSASGFVESKS